MGFKSDKQRKGFFANKGNNSKTASFSARPLSSEEMKSRSNDSAEYELSTKYDGRKSFYGKAKIRHEDNKKILKSYSTDVAFIKDGKAVVNGTYSATTLRHIKEFLKQNGFKAENSKQIEKDYILSSKKDSDSDGVVDSKDCEPFNPKKQGFMHDFHVKRLRAKEEKLEAKREKEMRKLEDIKDKLKERQGIASQKADIKSLKLQQKQAIIDEINTEKQKTNKLKQANIKAKKQLDKLTITGKVKTEIKKDSKLLAESTNAFLKKKSTRKALSKIGKSLGL